MKPALASSRRADVRACVRIATKIARTAPSFVVTARLLLQELSVPEIKFPTSLPAIMGPSRRSALEVAGILARLLRKSISAVAENGRLKLSAASGVRPAVLATPYAVYATLRACP